MGRAGSGGGSGGSNISSSGGHSARRNSGGHRVGDSGSTRAGQGMSSSSHNQGYFLARNNPCGF